MKRLFAVLCLLFCAACQAAQMSEREFTEYFVARAATAVKEVQLQVVAPLQLKFTDQSGEQVLFLNNAYSTYASDPTRLDAVMSDQLRFLKARNEAAAEQGTQSIFAIIKPAAYIEAVARQIANSGIPGKAPSLVYERLNDDMCVLYAFDTESGMRMLMSSDLETHKLDRAGLRALALRNLGAYFEKTGVEVNRLKKAGEAKVYYVQLDDNYEASILLLDQYWKPGRFDVKGELVVFAPARNLVLVTGTGEREGLEVASRIAARAHAEAGYAISPKGYVRDGGSWKPYLP